MAQNAGGYVGWEEVVVSGEKGRREVHYYLRDDRGGLDLAVVGRERSARHMNYAVPKRFFGSFDADGIFRRPSAQTSSPPSSLSSASTVTSVSGGAVPSRSPPSPPSSSSSAGSLSLKWRSRREVVDWLSSIVSGNNASFDCKNTDLSEDHCIKLKLQSQDFLWLGSSWTCRKQRKHYSSYFRYGVTISVHDFVYVMAEENKRLVAYVEDLYEDLKARKMVVVRWFHKIDEVNILLPPDVNDREIFFSLCLQDLSVECIDGLAAVLSAQHFEKYVNEAIQSPWKPFVCCRQVDNEDVKPFDITNLRGYWNQELLKSIYQYPKLQSKSASCNISTSNSPCESFLDHKPKRKNRMTSDDDVKPRLRIKIRKVSDSNISGRHASDLPPPAPLPPKKSPTQKIQQHLFAGCLVEVLSQDSGLRGCWFRCVVLKRHLDKVKVRYLDLLDADEKGHLEEWISSSRVAVPDKLGIRLQGRTILRPRPPNLAHTSPVFGVGSTVDVWWHDGWWEGIVISKEAEHKLNVYFPGEQRSAVFSPYDMRCSLDWSCEVWKILGDRPDFVCPQMSLKVQENVRKDSEGCTTSQEPSSDIESPSVGTSGDARIRNCSDLMQAREVEVVLELADDLPAILRWSSSRKRTCRFRSNARCRGEKTNCDLSGVSSMKSPSACASLRGPQTLVPDGNCKFRGDPFFNDPAAISNLVASR